MHVFSRYGPTGCYRQPLSIQWRLFGLLQAVHELFSALTRVGNRAVNRLPRAGGTGRTDTEEEDIMLLDDKTLGGRGLLVEGAAGEFKNPVAVMTMEMMMVPLAGPLVQGAHDRMTDRFEPALLDQQLEVAVDRGLIERFHPGPALLEDFLDPQGPIRNAEDLFYCCSLRCFSLHMLSTFPFTIAIAPSYCKRFCNID